MVAVSSKFPRTFGAGSSISLVFDESANTWAVAGIGASNGIDNRLESSTPDVNFEANAPAGMTEQDLTEPFGTNDYNGDVLHINLSMYLKVESDISVTTIVTKAVVH